MNQVTRRRLKRLEMDDYDLGHLDNWCRGRAAVPPWPSCWRSVPRKPSPCWSQRPASPGTRPSACHQAPKPAPSVSPCAALPSRPGRPRRKTARPPGQRPLPSPPPPLIPQQRAAHAAAPRREPNQMNRAERATPTVLTAAPQRRSRCQSPTGSPASASPLHPPEPLPCSPRRARDHTSPTPLARPHHPPARHRQHPAVQRPSHPLDERRIRAAVVGA